MNTVSCINLNFSLLTQARPKYQSMVVWLSGKKKPIRFPPVYVQNGLLELEVVGVCTAADTAANRTDRTNTMRVEHRPFVTDGALVSALATRFDEYTDQRWSVERYGENWETARVQGVVQRVNGTRVRVRWEDNTVIPLDLVDLELAGETLRSAMEATEGSDNS